MNAVLLICGLSLTAFALLTDTGCVPGTVSVKSPTVGAPTEFDTRMALIHIADRWPEMRPDVSRDEARRLLSVLAVHYSSDPRDFPKPVNPTEVCTGWQFGNEIWILVDNRWPGLRNNSLVHEAVHWLLEANGEDSTHDPKTGHGGVNWTPEMYAWVKSVQGDL